MVGCSAYNCTGKGKSLFLFPENPQLRKQWVRNTKRANFRPSATSRLCQDHFKPICFERNPEMMELTGVYFKLKLKPDAVPTEFDFSSPKIKCQMKGKKTYLASKFKRQLEPRLSPRKNASTAAGGALVKRKRQEVCLS